MVTLFMMMSVPVVDCFTFLLLWREMLGC